MKRKLWHDENQAPPGSTEPAKQMVSHLLQGKSNPSLSTLLHLIFTHIDSSNPTKTPAQVYSFKDYTTLKTSMKLVLCSFAIQVSKQWLVFEAKKAVMPDKGLHASLRRNSRHWVEWSNVGVATVETTKEILQNHQQIAWGFMNVISGDDVVDGLEGLAEEERSSNKGSKHRPAELSILTVICKK
ncbi:hypothetical protein H1R20_g8000, partial [Candolleomyces eurysporus]